MTTETHAIPCRCGATLTEETYDLHMHANHRTPERMREDQDRAVLARIGGNEYRRRLDGPRRWTMADVDRWAAEDSASLLAGESYLTGAYSAPYIGSKPEWSTPAVFHGLTHHMSKRPDPARAKLPESCFDWPIYQFAMIRLAIETLTSNAAIVPGMGRDPGDPVWLYAQDIGNALNLWPSRDDD